MNVHNFWNNQPIDISKNSTESKYINLKKIEEIQKEPYQLPKAFEWYNIDLNNDNELKELLEFIGNYYYYDSSKPVEFTLDFFRWLTMPPNDLIITIKCLNKIVACICGIPMDLLIYGEKVKAMQINFLCVHPKMRNKNFAPLLIKEVTRRTNLKDIWTAIYTGDKNLPNELVRCDTYIRPLNISKLVDLEIMERPKNNEFKTIKHPTLNIRKLNENDCEICCEKFNNFQKKYKIAVYFELENFKHHFLGIDSYVVETDNEITDFFSFFPLNIKYKDPKKYEKINRYILYHYFNLKNDINELIENLLYIIKNKGGDYVSCLEQYDNKKFFNNLEFKRATTYLNFFLYNWICPAIEKKDLGVILI